MLHVAHQVPRKDVLLGLVWAEKIAVDVYPDGFDEMLRKTVSTRSSGLEEDDERRRVAARDILRNGSYKPTGRGKPASEYLLRAVTDPEYRFPRINSPVDICNYLSLKHVVPISLWDLDRAGTDRYVFRLGQEEEGYVFNEGGQRIDVEDLLVGCRVLGDDDAGGDPVVNPVRDSQETKTTSKTRRVGACVYAPVHVISVQQLNALCRAFADLLAACGDGVVSAYGVLFPNESQHI